MYSFPCESLAHPSGCNQELPYFPQISQYVSTLFPNTESYGRTQIKDRVGLALGVEPFRYIVMLQLILGPKKHQWPWLSCEYIRYHQESHYISSSESAKIIALPSVFLDILK